MVNGVARRVMHFQASACHDEFITALDDLQAIHRRGFDFSPEHLHALSEDARRARHYFRCVEQVRRAQAVNIHLRLWHQLHERACRTRVIQVDMSCQDMGDILRRKTGFANRIQ